MRDKFKQMMLVRNYRIGKTREVGAADLDCATAVAVEGRQQHSWEGRGAWSPRKLRTGGSLVDLQTLTCRIPGLVSQDALAAGYPFLT